nr:VOC family protein [Angustibacter aerolatus]
MSEPSTTTPTGIHHVRLTVTDVRRSKAFYTEPARQRAGDGLHRPGGRPRGAPGPGAAVRGVHLRRRRPGCSACDPVPRAVTGSSRPEWASTT